MNHISEPLWSHPNSQGRGSVEAAARDRHNLAVALLTDLPPTITALAEEGGIVALQIVECNPAEIRANIPADRAWTGAEFKVRLRDEAGSGHDIHLVVRDPPPECADTRLAKLEIQAIRHVDGNRTHPRAQLNELALLRIRYSHQLAAQSEFDAHMADLSKHGLAIITPTPLHPGDQLVVAATLNGALVQLPARVLNTTIAHFGRIRVGCELLPTNDAITHQLTTLTSNGQNIGSPQQRMPPRTR